MSETKTFGSCLVKRDGNVATVIFNRPDKMNAFSPDLFQGFLEAFADVAGDDTVRAVIFTGAGDHFSAGGDVEQDIDPLRTLPVKEFKAYFEPLGGLYYGIYNLEKPTIAAIHGFALGAGMELTLMCDFRIAADNAQMGEFFVRMGLVPETGMCMLPKIVGPGWAKRICYTGDLVGAEEALRIGLVEQVVKKEELMPTAEKLARRLARGPASIKIMKRAINEFGNLPLGETLNGATTYQFQATRTRDHEEAVKSFLEKRRSNFTGE
jgi:enoyl-CoA hydratase